ncbi:MAG: Gfo/Idh/MocA family oxidoreductase [Clostridia bacterium]|nr:Gfo/Idh/MocA family oxidoreductase [Clostridia bacterium]
MKKIRWGIAGPGTIANKFAKAVKNVEGAELVAVAARSVEKGRAFAEKYDIPEVFEGFEAMAMSDKVDAVYVATPHPFHKSSAEIFLNNKKHVLCEKPICVNAAQAKALKECAAKNGVFLMEAMWTRFLPAIKEAAELVKNGEIGDVLGIEADFCYRIETEEDPKVFDNSLAGGGLLDVGVYGLHFASIFLGNSPEKISAVANVENGVDLHTAATLKYKNGAVAVITSAINLHKPETAYIYGTKGHIYLPNFYGANELFVAVGGDARYIENSAMGDGFEEEIIEVCDCIRAGKTESDILPLDESIAILGQMDEIRKQIGVKYPLEGEI